jgi:hypothetical protein
MENKRFALFPLAILCLLGIGYVIVKDKIPTTSSTNVLGAVSDKPKSMFGFFNNFVDDSLQNTKVNLSTKAVKLEKNIMTTVEAQAKDMADSQVKALKLQICTNWGVIPQTPSPQPSQ